MKSPTALLVIDVQKDLFDEVRSEDTAVLSCIAGLLEKVRARQIPILYIQHEEDSGYPLEPGTPGWQIHPQVAPHPHDVIIHKRASDAFYETELHEKLQSLGVSRLIITGAQTEYCVDATCRRAASLNYDVYLVADGHNTGDTETLTTAQIIAHHNHLLSQLAHPTHPIHVQPAAEIRF